MIHLLATGFGAGYVPVIPGTVGSLWGLPLVWGVKHLPGGVRVEAIVVSAIVLAGVVICAIGRRRFDRPDPPQIVFDEIAALPLVFLFMDVEQYDPQTALIGFIWFRAFDMLKPWPIKHAERLPGGIGIVADDVLAAAYAAAALLLTMQVLSRFA